MRFIDKTCLAVN